MENIKSNKLVIPSEFLIEQGSTTPTEVDPIIAREVQEFLDAIAEASASAEHSTIRFGNAA